MKRLERLHALSDVIRRSSPRPVSASVLAERFEVSRRTIERDLAALRAAGVPLYSERGRTGGQVSLDRSANSVLTLSGAEITALLVALAAAGEHMPLGDAATTASERRTEALRPTTRVAIEGLRSGIRLREQPPVPKRARRTVEEAWRRKVVVNIDYVDRNGDATERPVDPVGFYHGSDGWYLIGWCHLRRAGRIFRLDRITSARLTSKPAPDRGVDETLGWVPDEVRIP